MPFLDLLTLFTLNYCAIQLLTYSFFEMHWTSQISSVICEVPLYFFLLFNNKYFHFVI